MNRNHKVQQYIGEDQLQHLLSIDEMNVYLLEQYDFEVKESNLNGRFGYKFYNIKNTINQSILVGNLVKYFNLPNIINFIDRNSYGFVIDVTHNDISTNENNKEDIGGNNMYESVFILLIYTIRAVIERKIKCQKLDIQ